MKIRRLSAALFIIGSIGLATPALAQSWSDQGYYGRGYDDQGYGYGRSQGDGDQSYQGYSDQNQPYDQGLYDGGSSGDNGGYDQSDWANRNNDRSDDSGYRRRGDSADRGDCKWVWRRQNWVWQCW